MSTIPDSPSPMSLPAGIVRTPGLTLAGNRATMNRATFDELRKRAIELHKAQTGDKTKISLDAIFAALAFDDALQRAEPIKVRRASDEEPPQWFTDTLEQLKGSGEKITVARFLMLAGKFPATRPDSLNVGRWLREAGFIPRKTGGNMLFEF